MNTIEKALVLSVDNKGIIENIIKNDFFDLAIGDEFSCEFNVKSTQLCHEFLEELLKKSTALYEIVDYDDKKMMLSGYRLEKNILITMVELNKNSFNEKQNTVLNHELEKTYNRIDALISESEDNKTLIGQMSIIDNLTGLYNRMYLESKFNEVINLQQRLKHKVAIVYIDLNHFRMVNDTFGYEEGDRLLIKFSTICREMTRNDFDFVFRIGGDEFMIFMVDCSVTAASEVCKRLSDSFKKHTVVSSISYGIVPLDSEEEEDLSYYMSEAEQEMLLYKDVYIKNENFGEVN